MRGGRMADRSDPARRTERRRFARSGAARTRRRVSSGDTPTAPAASASPVSPDLRTVRIEKYRTDLAAANNESVRRERTAGLLRDLFGHDSGARKVLDAMEDGAELALKIPLPTRVKTGFADTQYGRTIIEYKGDLAADLSAAERQLREYVAANWKAGQPYRFKLIATDGVAWRTYEPHGERLTAAAAGVTHDRALTPDAVELVARDGFDLAADNGGDFYYFLDQHLFRLEPTPPTLEAVEREFGETGPSFITALAALRKHYAAVKDDPELQTALGEWRRFLSIAYGRFERGPEMFLVHTYLSAFSKILAYEVLTHDDRIDDDELRGILTGGIFDGLNVRGFIDRDFFAWVAREPHLKALTPAFREVAAAVGRFDFTHVSEDVLKGVYQELIDLDTRHALGEYYTPDWLCHRVLAEFTPAADAKFLDPACGSGSFLRAAVARLRELHPDLGPHELAAQVVGIDIHPLSVQIAKTTMLIALGQSVRDDRRPVELRVYLANTLRTPEGTVGEMFGNSFKVRVGGKTLTLSETLLNSARVFDAGLRAAEELAELTRGRGDDPGHPDPGPNALANAVKQAIGTGLSPGQADDFHRLYGAFRETMEAGRDGIWRFIVQNLLRPFLLKGRFDYVVGNPPWLTYSDVAVAGYQDELTALAAKYKVLPSKANNRTHLEIATIFQAHAASTFLKPRKEGGGEMALVLPRSFLSADHHRETRDGTARGFKITGVWDLDDVSPLFRVPSCVLRASNNPGGRMLNTKPSRQPNKSGTPGYRVSGKLRGHNQTWEQAGERLTFEPATWYVGTLGTRTAFTRRRPGKAAGGGNPYKPLFRQGATIVPRNAYFVHVTQEVPDLDDRSVPIETEPVQAKQAKAPWKGATFRGRVHSDLLFRTALSNSLLPFALVDPALVVLPAARIARGGGLVTDGGVAESVRLLSPADLRAAGRLDAARWFAELEVYWERHKTQRSKAMSFLDRLDYSKGLTKQTAPGRFLVLYNSSAKDANAAVFERGTLDRPFIVESKAYWFATESRAEADYLAAFLNADEPNAVMKDYQSRGLFGARDVHKTILDVPLPAFDRTDADHAALAELGAACAAKAAAWVAAGGMADAGGRVGTARSKLRKHLAAELGEIDRALRRLV